MSKPDALDKFSDAVYWAISDFQELGVPVLPPAFELAKDRSVVGELQHLSVDGCAEALILRALEESRR